LKRCPFSLVLSQAKYFYNYFSFFIIKILVWRTLIEAQNFQFTTKTPMFFSHCYPPFSLFFSVGQAYSFASFGLCFGFVWLANVYDCEGLAL